MHNSRAVLWHLPIIEVLAAFIDNIMNVDVAAPENEGQHSINRVSTQRQQSVNRLSTILGGASCVIQGLCYGIYP